MSTELAETGEIAMIQRTLISAIQIVLMGLAIPTAALDRGPQGVSPGAPDRLAGVDSTCPTFTWEATPETQRYELVVYRLDAETETTASIELSADNEVLYAAISGRATGWTPESSDCFAPGESYAWFVRSVTDADTGDGSDWSQPRFFEVAAAPSAEELERAIEVIRRWRAVTSDGSPTLLSDAVSATDTVPVSGTGSGSGSGSKRTKSVITGTAAIRGEQPDPTGETYGVVGTSASPDGAGIGAANTAGGPDLVLDGTVPAELTEAGVVRSATTIETFTFNNPDIGELDVAVEGWIFSQQFVGGGAQLTDVDAETLDGTDGAAFATEAEAAAFVAAHAASADHDSRYYTKSELSTSGTPDAVHWNNLGGVPPGFADGIDNDTTYSFGPGLIVDNGQITIDPAAFQPKISTLDSAGHVGWYSSLAIGSDGLGLISYYDSSNADLKVAHCGNTTCSSAAVSTLDTSGWVGLYTSIAIGDDGLGLISYYDQSNQDLKVAHCDNTTCSSATIATLDSSGNVGWENSIAIGDDGLGLISYHDATSFDLKVAHCDDTACSSATIATLDSSGSVGWATSIAIGSDGLGLISYYDQSNQNLKVAHCNNTTCSSATIATLDSSGHVGLHSSVAIGSDGLGLISYFGVTNLDLKVAHCNNTTCSAASTLTVDNGGNVGRWTSLTIGTDGLGLISYQDQTNLEYMAAHCKDILCTSATVTALDRCVSTGSYTSVTIGDDSFPLISYLDDTNHDLKVIRLPYGY